MSKERKASRGTPAGAGEDVHAELRPLGQLAAEVLRSAQAELSQASQSRDALVIFDRHVLERGWNILDAARLLVMQGHWEVGFATTRQLFELLINMEYLSAQSDRSLSASRFFRYGQLQVLRAARGRFEYERDSPLTVDHQRLVELDAEIAKPIFDDFRHRPKADGGENWAKSWNSKNARELSEMSNSRIRRKQYELLFSSWSEQVHATPGALVGQIMREDMRRDNAKTARDEVVSRSMECLGIAITLFIELWVSLPNVAGLSAEDALRWFQDLHRETAPRIAAEFGPEPSSGVRHPSAGRQ